MRRAEHAAPPPEQAVLRAVGALARALRDHGLSTSVDGELVLYRALAELDMRERASVYWAASSTLVHDPDERPAFDAVFDRFWDGRPLEFVERVAEHGESDPRM